jgi:streptogramin lyase
MFTAETDSALEGDGAFPLPDHYANVRQLAGRKGEVWVAESGADKLFVLKAE